MTPAVGSLFSGVGMFDLGFERAGFRVAWQCEIDRTARDVLARHWPDGPRYRMCGNGVVVPVVEWLARRMARVFARRERVRC